MSGAAAGAAAEGPRPQAPSPQALAGGSTESGTVPGRPPARRGGARPGRRLVTAPPRARSSLTDVITEWMARIAGHQAAHRDCRARAGGKPLPPVAAT